MKRLILFELIVLFLATTFESDSPPGWFQQVLPTNDFITDIYFLDSLTGWLVTDGEDNPQDTGYVMRTTDGGANWVVQFNIIDKFQTIGFTDLNTGYVAGGTGNSRLFKTTNGGSNWFNINFKPFGRYEDLFFVNNNTGWVCDANSIDGGLWKTTNGGLNWQPQLGASSFPKKLFFLNQDTGWVASSEANGKLYRSTNGGQIWNLQYTFSSGLGDVYFFNGLRGVVSSGRFYTTTDGGNNWSMSPSTQIGGKMTFVSGGTGWAGQDISRIAKTIDTGNTWFYQTSPVFNNYSVSGVDSQKAWAGGSGLVHTTDGGGPPVAIQQISSEVPSEYRLFQNYPNPFNPVTKIKYQIVNSKYVKLIVFNIQGKEVITLVDQKQTAGTYEADWSAAGGALNYPSGVYFYSLIIDGLTVETRKMVLVK